MQPLWPNAAASPSVSDAQARPRTAAVPSHTTYITQQQHTLWMHTGGGAASFSSASDASVAAVTVMDPTAAAAAAASPSGAPFSPSPRSKRSRHVPSALLASRHLPPAAESSDSPPPPDPDAATLRPDFFSPAILQPSSRGFEAPPSLLGSSNFGVQQHAATIASQHAAAAASQQHAAAASPHRLPHAALAQSGKKRQRSEGEGEVSAMLTGLRVDQDRQHAHAGAGAGANHMQHAHASSMASSSSSSAMHPSKPAVNPFAAFSSALARAPIGPLASVAASSSPTPSPAGSAAIASLAPRFPSPGSEGEEWGAASSAGDSVGSSPSPHPPLPPSGAQRYADHEHAHAASSISLDAMNQYAKSRFNTRSTSNETMRMVTSSAAANTAAASSSTSATALAASRHGGTDPFVPPLLVESSVLSELSRYVPAGTPGLSPPVLALMLLSKFDPSSIPTLGAPLSSVQFLAGLRAVGCADDAAVTALLHGMIRDFAPACSAANAFANNANGNNDAAASSSTNPHSNGHGVNSFKIFYLACFTLLRKLLCSPLKKSLDLSSARYFLGLLLLDRFSSHMHPFLSFLDQLLANQSLHDARTPPAPGKPVAHNAFLLPPDGLRMSFDQWSCLFEWVHQIHPHTLEGYKEDAAWPVLMDDFVRWMMDRSTVVRLAAKHAQEEAAAAHAQEAAALAREQQMQQQKQRMLAASPLASSKHSLSASSPNGHNSHSSNGGSGGSPYSYSGLSRTPSRLDKFLIGPKAAAADPLEVLPLDAEESAGGATTMETLAEEGDEMQQQLAAVPLERASPAVQAAAAARAELDQRRARLQLSSSHTPLRSSQLPRPLGSPLPQQSSIMHIAAPTRSMQQHDSVAAMHPPHAAASSSFASAPARSPSSAMDDA